jgi:hypothetical protein
MLEHATHSGGVDFKTEIQFSTKFDYMFPEHARSPHCLLPPELATLEGLLMLGEAMADPGVQGAPDPFDSGIPAGFTYLGQFIDHDITARTDRELFESRIAELDGTLLGIQSFGVEVATETQQVSTGLDEIRETSTEVSQSIEEIAAGATRQTDKLSKAGDELTDLSATIEEIASSADEVATLSKEAASAATDGTDLAEESMETMDEIQSQTDATVDRIDGVDVGGGPVTRLLAHLYDERIVAGE